MAEKLDNPDLEAIRAVFPNWPSELDVAKAPGIWLAMAQSFFSAAQVLNQEGDRVHESLHSDRRHKLDLDTLMRMQTNTAAFFCLAFSLELAVKGTLVSQGAIENQESGKPLSIGSHNLSVLAKQIHGLALDHREMNTLKTATLIIADGKYPTGKRPSDMSNGVPPNAGFRDFAGPAEGIYNKLIRLTTNGA